MVNARSIVRLLARRHSKDVFIPECKDGPTWGLTGDDGHLRLDAWAMKRSWANPATYGYEVKVSRSDFLQDDKWPGYLPLCSDFYFACPHGLINPAELPDGVGLLWAASTGSRLYAKRKAKHRDVEPPRELLYYALMRATDFYRAIPRERTARREGWSEWLEARDENSETGLHIKRTIGREVDARCREVISENGRLRAENETLALAREVMGEIGLLTEEGRVAAGKWAIRDRIRGAVEGELPRVMRAAEEVGRAVDRLKAMIQHEVGAEEDAA
jgi:hypothetical protein